MHVARAGPHHPRCPPAPVEAEVNEVLYSKTATTPERGAVPSGKNFRDEVEHRLEVRGCKPSRPSIDCNQFPDGDRADVEAAAVDTLCDYCKDYTDAGASAGNVKSADRPFKGYAAESEQEQKLDVAKLRPQPDTAKPYKASN
jgi:hypothetical protein